MKELIYTSTPVHQYTSKKFCEFFTVIILTFMLIGSAKAQSCKPILSGIHSMCSEPHDGTPADFQIVNFNSSLSYNATVISYPGGTSNTFSVTTNIFPAFTITSSYIPINVLVIINSFDPSTNCSGSDSIFVQSCCEEFNAAVVSDFTTIQIPNTLSNGTITYDPLQVPGAPVRVAIHGELTVDQDLIFANTQIIMDQGASIRILSGKELALNNSTITAGRCNYMWKGIILENNSALKTQNGSSISDAHYAINVLENASFAFSELSSLTTNFSRNYISFYAGKNVNGHTIEMSGGNNPGININGLPNLLTPYWGQPSVPLSNSFAGIYLRDVQNFTNKQIGTITPININNINLGIASFNSSLDLPSNITLNNIAPVQINGQDIFTTTSSYNGSAIYGEASSSSPKTVSVGNSSTSNANLNSISNCKYGVHANKNVNVLVDNNIFQNINDHGGVRVTSCGNRNIEIRNNQFLASFRGAILCSQIPFAHLIIEQNNFNTGAYSQASLTPNFNNTAIRITNKSVAPVYGQIINNQINTARIGIYLSNVQGLNNGADNFEINNNNIVFNRSLSSYTTSQGSYIHYGIWANNTGNLNIGDNFISQTQPLIGAPANFEQYSTGILLQDAHFGSTIIEGNTIQWLGTGINITGNCLGTTTKCNLIYSNTNVTFPRGIYFNFAKITNQGSFSFPTENSFLSFSSLPIAYKISGTLNLTTPINWFSSSNNNILPYNVNPSPIFSTPPSVIPPSNYCGNANIIISPDEIRNFVHRVIYNEIVYEENEEENRYLDMVFSFRYLMSDSVFLNSDNENLLFLENHANDNIGNYVSAEALRNEDQVALALFKLNSIVALNEMEETLITTERIALNSEYEERLLLDSEKIELEPISNLNVLVAGQAVINARTMLEKEIYTEPSFIRKRNSLITSNTTLTETYIEQNYEIGKINVLVYDPIGKEIFNGGYNSWKNFKRNKNFTFVALRYYFDNNYIGSQKQVLFK